MLEKGRTIKIDWMAVIIYLIIFAGLIAMWINAGNRSLWNDDLSQMTMVLRPNTIKEFFEGIRAGDNNPPLSHLITEVWIRIAPYGTAWMKLPSILFVGLAVVFIAKTGRRVYNDLVGVLAAILGISSMHIIMLGAYTVRPYGLLYLAIAFLCYLYVRRYENDSTKLRILYTLAMIFCLYTHYFSIFVIFSLFLGECIQMIQKRQKQIGHSLLTYLVAGIAILPWFLYSMTAYYNKLQTFWAERPNPEKILGIFQKLLGASQAVQWVFLLETALLVSGLFWKEEQKKQEKVLRILLLSIIITIGIVYVYSRYINPDGSVFVDRYFISIAPQTILLAAIGMGRLVDVFSGDAKKRCILTVGAVMICISSAYSNVNSLHKESLKKGEPYEECAEYIMQCPDIYQDDVIVYNTSYELCDEGWNYYLTHNGERAPILVYYNKELLNVSLESVNRIYVVKLHNSIKTSVEEVLEAEFECVAVDETTGIEIWDRMKDK